MKKKPLIVRQMTEVFPCRKSWVFRLLYDVYDGHRWMVKKWHFWYDVIKQSSLTSMLSVIWSFRICRDKWLDSSRVEDKSGISGNLPGITRNLPWIIGALILFNSQNDATFLCHLTLQRNDRRSNYWPNQLVTSQTMIIPMQTELITSMTRLNCNFWCTQLNLTFLIPN